MLIESSNADVSDPTSKPGLKRMVVCALGMLCLVSCEAQAPSPVIGTYFSPDYVTARGRFREAAEQAGGRLTSLELAARGPGGEDLTIDIAWFGAERPRRAFVHHPAFMGSKRLQDLPSNCSGWMRAFPRYRRSRRSSSCMSSTRMGWRGCGGSTSTMSI